VPAVRTERQEWIRQGLTALAEGGPEAVRVETLATRLGVTKGGFYWHFKDRNALLEEVLQSWEQLAVDEIIQRVDAEPREGKEKLRALFDLAEASSHLAQVELAVRHWARRDERVARHLCRVDDRRMDYLRSLFRMICPDPLEVEARSLLAMTLYVANQLVAVQHGPWQRRDILKRAEGMLLD